MTTATTEPIIIITFYIKSQKRNKLHFNYTYRLGRDQMVHFIKLQGKLMHVCLAKFFSI